MAATAQACSEPMADADVRPSGSPVPSDLTAVRQAWRQSRPAPDLRSAALAAALRGFACQGREAGMPIATLLRALDALARRDDGEAGFERVREWAGTQVIRAYFRAD